MRRGNARLFANIFGLITANVRRTETRRLEETLTVRLVRQISYSLAPLDRVRDRPPRRESFAFLSNPGPKLLGPLVLCYWHPGSDPSDRRDIVTSVVPSGFQ